MGGACSMDGRNEKHVQYFGCKTWREDLGVDGKITLERILEK
jgi:hypothetical protein